MGLCPLMSPRSGRIFAVMEGAFLSGQMLIAMPGIGDPRFERSLILVCAHDHEHAMGVAVNRPVEGLTVSGCWSVSRCPPPPTWRTTWS